MKSKLRGAAAGRWGASVAALVSVGFGTPAAADTLREALGLAYQTNPTLTGARAGLRATDEDVGIARAQGLPDVSATGSYNEFVKRSPGVSTSSRMSPDLISLDDPLRRTR